MKGDVIVKTGPLQGRRGRVKQCHRSALLRQDEQPYPLVVDVVIDDQVHVMHIEDLKEV